MRPRGQLADRGDKAGMIVGDDQFDTLETARLQAHEEVAPGRAALAIGHLDGQDLAPSVPVDADRDQHRLAHDDAGFTHLLIARVEDEVRKRLLKRVPGKGGEALVQTLVIAFTLRVDTPWTYISASVATKARADRW